MSRNGFLAMLVAGILLAGVGVGALVTAPRLPTQRPAQLPDPAQIIPKEPFQRPAPVPSAIPGPTQANTKGIGIKVTDLGIDLPIVEGDGVNAPLYKAAHYPGTAWPGNGGRSVIYAHAQTGMFGPVFKTKVGMRLQITRQDGPPLNYVVTEYYSDWPITDLRWLKPADFDELVLVTCTTYNLNDPRQIVVARPQ